MPDRFLDCGLRADDLDDEVCLLDAFCEDEGLSFAKLDALERRAGMASTSPMREMVA